MYLAQVRSNRFTSWNFGAWIVPCDHQKSTLWILSSASLQYLTQLATGIAWSCQICQLYDTYFTDGLWSCKPSNLPQTNLHGMSTTWGKETGKGQAGRRCAGRGQSGSGQSARRSINLVEPPWVGSAKGVWLTAGVRLEESTVKGSSWADGSGCPEGPEVIDRLGVGPGVSLVVLIFCVIYVAHCSKMYLSAYPAASSQCWPSKLQPLPYLAPHFNQLRTQAHMVNPKTTASVTIQQPADPTQSCVVLSTSWNSRAWNWSIVCLSTSSHSAVTSADGLCTTSHDGMTFMVGSVHCVDF